MAMTKDQEQFVQMMKNPEVKKALRGNGDDKELEELLADLDIGDDDTIESVAKKSQAKIKKLVKYFKNEVANAKKDAVDEATKDTREREAAEIRAFAAKNPGMKNDDVLTVMQQLFNKGKSLEVAYKAACKANDIDPVTGKEPEEEEDEPKKEAKKRVAKKKVQGAKSSAKSDAGEEDDVDDDVDADDTPMSLDDALASASSAYIAKNGNPFDASEE